MVNSSPDVSQSATMNPRPSENTTATPAPATPTPAGTAPATPAPASTAPATTKTSPKKPPDNSTSRKKASPTSSSGGYECTLILHPDLNDDAQDNLLQKFKKLFEEQGGKLTHQTRWGKRKLAYPIKKQTYGHYYILYLSLHPLALHALEKQFCIEEKVFRWLSIRVEDYKAELAAFEEMKQSQEKAQKEQELTP